MTFVSRITRLYEPDNRTGDSLLQPQRYCNRQWRRITSPFPQNAQPFFEVVKRIQKAVVLILPTLASYLLGVVAIGIKACSKAPVLSVRNRLDPPIAAGTSDARLEVPQALLHLDENETPILSLPKDVVLFMTQYLPIQDRLSLRRVSRAFHNAASADILWQEQLGQYRIWGPHKHWGFQRVRNGLQAVALNGDGRGPLAFEQLRAYRDLLNLPERDFPEFFDYLARLNKGGPILFKQLLANSEVVGKNILGQNFLSLRLIDKSIENPVPFVLTFTEGARWNHNQAGPFSQNQINIHNTSHRNYVLNLMTGEPHTVIPYGFHAQIEIS